MSLATLTQPDRARLAERLATAQIAIDALEVALDDVSAFGACYGSERRAAYPLLTQARRLRAGLSELKKLLEKGG